MASLKKSHASSGSSHSKAAKFKRYLPLYLMFLPGAIYLLINNYIPMAGIIVAFKKYNCLLYTSDAADDRISLVGGGGGGR